MGIDADFLRRQQQASVIRLSGEHKIGCACPHYLDRSNCPGPCPRGAQRRRYATRDELIDLLADAVSDVASPRSVVDHLAEMGVDVNALVKITVQED
jgi:hypothetical protein